MSQSIEEIKNKKAFICDMDGVIYHGNRLLPDVHEFVDWLYKNDKQFLFLTNSSERSPRELSQKLKRMGLDVSEDHFYTSALATASFLSSQKPGCSVYAIGEPGLVNALYDAGLSMNDYNPDYVVFGETRALNYEKIEHAVQLVLDKPIAEAVRRHARRSRLRSRSISGRGMELIYELRIRDDAALAAEVAAVPGVSSVNVLAHDGELRL